MTGAPAPEGRKAEMSPADEAGAAPKSRASAIVGWLEYCEESLLLAAMATTFALLLLQVFSRYVFNWPLAWTEELARYLFVWSVFIGASQAMRTREHIAIGMVVDRLPRRLAIVVALVMSALVASFLLVVIVKGIELAAKVADLPSTALEVSMAFVYVPVPLAGAIMLIRLIADAYRIATTGPIEIEHRSL